MPDDTPGSVPFHYIKSTLFRVLHADGAVGNITPAGLIFFGLYSERTPIPQLMVHDITSEGQIGHERAEERVARRGIVREVDVGVMMSVETASNLITWLQDKVDLIRKMQKIAESEKR